MAISKITENGLTVIDLKVVKTAKEVNEEAAKAESPKG